MADAARAAGAADAKLLAGGQSLLAAMKLGLAAPAALVDLGGLAELKGISVSGGTVKIGAMTTHAAVAASKEVAQAIPALAALAGGIGDRQVRNRGTIGGSLANNDPAADYPAAVLALGATIHTDQRTIAADDFFKGLYADRAQRRRGHHRGELPGAREGRLAEVQAAGVALRAGRRVRRQGQGRRARRGHRCRAERRVPRQGAGRQAARPTGRRSACDGVKIDAKGLNSDLHGSAEYRAALIPVLAKRAVG